MYFFVLIILVAVLLINLERININFIYLKILIVSTIYFYYLHILKFSILDLLLTILSFSTIIMLIYRLLKNDIKDKSEDYSLFNFAHEIKNPLAVCKGYLDMLDISDNKKVNKYIPIIRKEIERSLEIINDFLDTKRINLNKDLMDISLLIEEIEDMLKYIFEDANIRFSIPTIEKEIIINGDYDKLKQVIINLIKNAYEAEAKNIKIDLGINHNNLILKVIDDGRGISECNIKRIGELFYTTKVTGTGVGVNMAKEIIKLHDGNLSYKSKINKGTTAIISLPIEYIY